MQETAVAAIECEAPVIARRHAWLKAVARRLAARRLRGESRRIQRERKAARPEALPNTAELVERAEVAAQVSAAARALPEPFRRTILLHFLEGMSVDEIARNEEKPADTVRWRVRRGLELIRQELVREQDRDWSSWCVLLQPLARPRGEMAGSAAGGVTAGGSFVAFTSAVKMKLIVTAAVVIVVTSLWLVSGSPFGSDPVGSETYEGDRENQRAAMQPRTQVESGVALPPKQSGPARNGAPSRSRIEDGGGSVDSDTTGFAGVVIDDTGEPIAGATVYLVPSDSKESRARNAKSEVLARTESGGDGQFRLEPDDWESKPSGSLGTLDLGVVANGFLRQIVPDPTGDELVVIMPRGQTLSGNVIDEPGRPVIGLRLLALTVRDAIQHVSPSQMAMRAKLSELGGASSRYHHCLGETDAFGAIAFSGLPDEDIEVLALDPGWTIENPSRARADESPHVWSAVPRLGVRLIVVDSVHGSPVDRANAVFRVELTFADGEIQDMGQWVGRGKGEVTFVLGPGTLPSNMVRRNVTRAAFYGTVSVGETKVPWRAEAIDDPVKAVGVAELTVMIDPSARTEIETQVEAKVEEPPSATLQLDAGFADGAPYTGKLVVRWTSRTDEGIVVDGVARVDPDSAGLYHVDLAAGDVTLNVYQFSASGSLPSWTGEVRCGTRRLNRMSVTLTRGAAVTINRPEGWIDEWFVHASWRTPGTEKWQGSWGYSTKDTELELTALRPSEWRFQLRRYSESDPDPIVRTVILGEGTSMIVDGQAPTPR